MSEHHVAIVSFDGALKREIKRIRNELAKAEGLTSFKITINASGRTLDGEVKLTYSVAENEYGVGVVEGDSMNAVIDEMLRRHGWKKIHAAKALSYEKIPSDDTDDIPF